MSTKHYFDPVCIFKANKNRTVLSALTKPKPYKKIGHGLTMLLAILFCNPASADNPYLAAKNLVIKQGCMHGQTVDEVLDHKVRPSRRDLGWRVFETDGGYVVERAFMVSKAMEIRYRWHVSAQGEIYAENSRSENLCS